MPCERRRTALGHAKTGLRAWSRGAQVTGGAWTGTRAPLDRLAGQTHRVLESSTYLSAHRLAQLGRLLRAKRSRTGATKETWEG